MGHININSSVSVYHILHWVGECRKSGGLLNLVVGLRRYNGYYSINLFLSDPAKHQVVLVERPVRTSRHLPHVIMSYPPTMAHVSLSQTCATLKEMVMGHWDISVIPRDAPFQDLLTIHC